MLSFYGATRNETTAALVKSNERSKRTKCEFGFVAVITIWLVFWGLCVRILDGELEELVDITLDSELEETRRHYTGECGTNQDGSRMVTTTC